LRFGFRVLALRTGLALLGVALFCGYAMAPQLAFLPYVALVPWTILYTDPRRPRVSPLYFLFVGYVCWILCYKMTFRFGWFVPPAMALFFVPAWLLFPWLARPIQRLGLPRSITLPVVWVAVEWARLLLATGHFELFALGYSQARFSPLVQIADVTGVYGVSFLVAAVNGLIADAWFILKATAWRPRILLRERLIVVPAMAVVSAFVAAFGYGVVRLESARETPGPRLAIVQPNLEPTVSSSFGTALVQLYQTDESVPPGSADLIVWPENAILDNIDRKAAYLDDLAWLASRKEAPILLGARGRAEGFVGRTTNSAFLVDEGGALRGRYDKQILFPFSEYVPLDRAIGVVAPPVQRAYRGLIRRVWGSMSNGAPGRNSTLFELPWNGGTIPFAALIGLENAYPSLVAEASRRGARFLVNLTSEGEVGGALEEQLLRVCMLRAVENRIAYVRAGNTGISGFIDPQGRLRSVLRGERGGTITVTGVLTDTVALSLGGTTVYAASRDAFALLCVAVSLWLLARAILRGPPTMTPHPVPATAAVAVVLAALMLHGCRGPGRDFSEACPDESTCRDALEKTAAAYRLADASEDALGFFERVIATYPALVPEARGYRAYFLESCGDPLPALGEYQAALKSAPSARVFSLLGNLRSRIGDAPGALVAYRAAHDLAPGDPVMLSLVARTEWEQGKTADAHELVAAVLAMAPDEPNALTLLANIDQAEGAETEALSALTRAAVSDPTHLECRYHLSRLAWRAGERDKARQWLGELRAIEATLGSRLND
jgi:apolipoprotein N-acyltransferase